MAVIQNTIEIDRSPEKVFDYLIDLRNELEWNPDVVSMEKMTEGPIALGTKYRAKWKQSTSIVCECTKFDRPNSWSYVNGGPVAVPLDISLTRRGQYTTLLSRFDAHPRGFFTLIFPSFMQIMKRQEKLAMTNINGAGTSGRCRVRAIEQSD